MTSLAATRLAALAGLALLLSSAAVTAQSSSERLTGMKLSNDLPIQIESDRLDVREADSVAEFTGNVSVVQDKTLLKAGKLIVYYVKDGGSAATGSSAIDRLEVSGKVYVKSETQVATGDTGAFDMKSQVLVLSGSKVVLSEGNNVAVGCKLTVQMKTGQAKLESCKNGGRVSIVLDPKNK
ncbi:MAG: LptA/OstA family protein [Rhizobiaceae bacterium]